MIKKEEYLQPEVEIVHLTLEESLLNGSPKGKGANIVWDTPSDFDSFFGS